MNEQRRNIEQTASDILQKYNDDSGYYIDVVKIAKKMDFAVYEADISDGSESFVIIDENKIKLLDSYNKKNICISGDLYWTSKRIAIARELKFALDNSDKSHFIHKTYEDDKRGIDLFAVSLLVPADKLIQENTKLLNQDLDFDKRTKILAQRFGVTWIMMVYRFGELGIY